MKKEDLFPILDTIAKGIADTFGSDCETLIHDLDTTDHPILSIYNGHISGRTAGSTMDILGRTSSSSFDINKLQHAHVNTLAERDGHKIKSTTIPVFAEDGVLGLGINFDYTRLDNVSQALKALTDVNGFLYEEINRKPAPQIDSLFQDAVRFTDKPADQLSKEERLMLLSRLSINHFFEQQRAVPYLAEQLGVSRYTIYKDLKELNGDGNDM